MPVHSLRGEAVSRHCPRCGVPLSPLGLTERRNVCPNTTCSWPNPEPGVIHALRWRLRGSADQALHQLRRRGLWPPIP